MVMLLSLEVLALKRKKDRVCQLTIRSLCMFLMRSARMILKKWAPLGKEQAMEACEGEANGKSPYHRIKE